MAKAKKQVAKPYECVMSDADQAELISIAERLEAAQSEGWTFTRRVLTEMYEPMREQDQPGVLVKRTMLVENFLQYLPPVTPAYATFRQYAGMIGSLLVSGIKVPDSADDARTLVKAANADLGIGRKRQAKAGGKAPAKDAKQGKDAANVLDLILPILKAEGKQRDRFIAALRKHGWEVMPSMEADKLRGDAKHDADAKPEGRHLRAA